MFQISLRSLLVLVTLVALAIVSLRCATGWWQIAVVTIALVAFWGTIILAVVDRGNRQAFAIGFALSMVLYAIALLLIGPLSGFGDNASREFNPATGQLLTSRLLRPLFESIAEVHSIDFRTGQVVPNSDPNTSGSGPGSQFISRSEIPDRGTFMVIGHSWWALLLGLCGGWFAKWVYSRRLQDPDSLASGRA